MQTNSTTEKMARPIRYAEQAQGMPSKAQKQAQAAQERGRAWQRQDKRAEPSPGLGYWVH